MAGRLMGKRMTGNSLWMMCWVQAFTSALIFDGRYRDGTASRFFDRQLELRLSGHEGQTRLATLRRIPWLEKTALVMSTSSPKTANRSAFRRATF